MRWQKWMWAAASVALLPMPVGTRPPEPPKVGPEYHEAFYPSKPVSKLEPLVPIQWDSSEFMDQDRMIYRLNTPQYSVAMETLTRFWLRADRQRYWVRYPSERYSGELRTILRVLVPGSKTFQHAPRRFGDAKVLVYPPSCPVFSVTLDATVEELSHWMDIQVGFHQEQVRDQTGKLTFGPMRMAVAISISQDIPRPRDVLSTIKVRDAQGKETPYYEQTWRKITRGNAFIYPRYDILSDPTAANRDAYFLFWEGDISWLTWLEDSKYEQFQQKLNEEWKRVESPGIELVHIYKYIPPPRLLQPSQGPLAREHEQIVIPATTHERVSQVFVHKNKDPKPNEPSWYWGVLMTVDKKQYQFIRKGPKNWEVWDMDDKPIKSNP